MAGKKNTQIIQNYHQYKDVTLDAVEDFNNKSYDKALERFLEMEKVNYKNLKIHEMLVYLYLKMDRIENAEKQYQIVVQLERENNYNFKEMKIFDQIVQDAGDISAVEEQYNQLINKEITADASIEVPAKLSVLYMSQGNYEKAEEIMVRFRDKFLEAYQTVSFN